MTYSEIVEKVTAKESLSAKDIGDKRMNCKELLEIGVKGEWYNITTHDGVFNVKFDIRKPTGFSGYLFSIENMPEKEKRIQVLEDMFKFAATSGEDKAIFKNNNCVMEVTFDVLETAE